MLCCDNNVKLHQETRVGSNLSSLLMHGVLVPDSSSRLMVTFKYDLVCPSKVSVRFVR